MLVFCTKVFVIGYALIIIAHLITEKVGYKIIPQNWDLWWLIGMGFVCIIQMPWIP
jgi:hypothetical protein